MKILEYPPYVTIKELEKFNRRKSGFGLVIWDITQSIASRGHQVDLLTKYNFTEKFNYRKVNFLKLNWRLIFISLRIRDVFKGMAFTIAAKIPRNKIPYAIYHYISVGYFNRILKENRYDLVHLHGIGYLTIPILEICQKHGVKIVVTLHGLNSFSDSIKLSSREKKIEKDFLQFAEDKSIPVTVVSTGVRSTILNYLNQRSSNNFVVVPNGIDLKRNKENNFISLRDIYNIPAHKKIMICVNRIDENKNQIQIVRAYSLLPENVKNKLVILFVGKDGSNGKFSEELNSSEEKNNLIVCGEISKNVVNSYYQQADYNIVTSISEGFGLSIVEGYSSGLPCLTFRDLDAVPDLYNPEAMLLVEERSDKKLSEGMEGMINLNWDNKKIKKIAQNFSLKIMANNYIRVFENLIDKQN